MIRQLSSVASERLQAETKQRRDRFPGFEELFTLDMSLLTSGAPSGMTPMKNNGIGTSDGHDTWGTVGVSENLIEASWQALVDSITYKLKKEYGYRRDEHKPRGGQVSSRADWLDPGGSQSQAAYNHGGPLKTMGTRCQGKAVRQPTD